MDNQLLNAKYCPLGKNNLARFKILALLVVLVVVLSIFSATAVSKQENQTLSGIVTSLQSASNTPNIDAAVFTPKFSCAVSAGSDAASSEFTKKFHAASISKLFTAIVIMQLKDEGLLALQDRVGLYEPSFSSSPIRIVHLLTHTSGLRDRQRAKGRTTQEQVNAYIDALAKQRINSLPGSKWRYSDAGYNLLGRIIERITRKPFPKLMKERLLDPIGMEDSSFDLSRIPQQQRHRAYSKRGKPKVHPWDRAFLPSSGLQTTAADLAAFGNEVLSISEGLPNPLIKVQSLIEMTTVRLKTDWTGVSQGYGWQLVITTSHGPQWRHAGGEAGFEALLTLYPKSHTAIAVLGNKKDWPRFELERTLSIRISTSPNLCTSGEDNELRTGEL